MQERLKKAVLNHKSILLAVALNCCFLGLLGVLNGFRYELSDDWFFSVNIAEGDYNFTFCNYFIQLVSGILQKAIYPVNAFILLQLILGFVAMTTIAYVFFDTYGIKKGFLLNLFLETAFALNAYSFITFSKTAGILIAAGGLVIVWAYCRKKRIGWSVYGIILTLLGSFYRIQIFYSVFAIFSFFILGYLLHQAVPFGMQGVWKQIKDFFRLRTILVLGILLVAVFSCQSLSKSIIYSDGSLDYYRKYNPARSSVVDFQLPDFEEEPERYEELGVSQNDIELLRNWYLDDQGVATLDTLKEISKIQKGRQAEKAYLLNMVMSFAGMAELLLLVVYIVTVLGIILIYRRKSWWFILSLAMAIGLLYGYLFMIGRSNYRSIFSIWFATVICLLFAIQFMDVRSWISKRKGSMRRIATCLCLAISLFFFTFGYAKVGPSITRTAVDRFPKLEEYIESSENKVFALGRAPYLLFRSMTQLDDALCFSENKAFRKCVYFGTPYFAHPSYNRLLQSAGIENLYTALAEKDNLYFVDHWELSDIEKIVHYLNEQYGQTERYDSQLVYEVEEFKIYQIVATDK